MKEREKSPSNATFAARIRSKRQDKQVGDVFLDNYLHCHLLYHMKISSQSNEQEDISTEQLSLIEHVFVNLHEMEEAETSRNTSKLPSNKTFMDTINHNDNSHSNEEQEYSNYLKQYETMIKYSRKRQYTSPEQQNKQMNLLIHQFLSDIHHPSHSTQTTAKTNKTPSKTSNKVKIEKIDLNAFSTHRSNANERNTSPHEEAKSKAGREKGNKEATPRFINLNDIKFKPKSKPTKSKEKVQIEVVKVQNVGPKINNLITYTNKIPPVTIAKKPRVDPQPHLPSQRSNSITSNPKQSNQDGYSSSYLKSKQIKGTANYSTKIQPPNSNTNQPQDGKHSKKPLKIEIEIPLDELNYIEQPIQPITTESIVSDSNNQGYRIIKEISDKVVSLIQKANDITIKRT